MRLRNLSLLILASPSLAVASPSLKAADPEGVSASKPVIARSPGINLGLEIQGLEPVYAHRDVVLCVEAKNAVLSISDISASGCQVKRVEEQDGGAEIHIYLAGEECSLSFIASDPTGTSTSKTVYFAKTGNKWYSSVLSLADAKAAYYRFESSAGSISETEARLAVSALSSENSARQIGIGGPIFPPISLYDYSDVSLSWQSSDGKEHPLSGVTVNLKKAYYANGTLVETTIDTKTTDDRGEATLKSLRTSNLDADYFLIEVVPENDSVSVKTSSGSAVCSIADEMIIDEVTDVDATYSYASDLGKAFQLFQIVEYCSRFAEEIDDGDEVGQCRVLLDGGKDYPEYVWNSGNTPTIMVNPNYGLSTSPVDSFEDWDTIAHEYGHHIAFEKGWVDTTTFEMHAASPGRHLFDYGLEEKEKDNNRFIEKGVAVTPDLALASAWSEGLATYLGAMALKYNSSHLSTIPLASDRYYTSANGLHYSYDTYTYSGPSDAGGTQIYSIHGDGDEYAISQLLYKMSDNLRDAHDLFGMGYGEVIDIVDSLTTHSFPSFFTHVYFGWDNEDIYNLTLLLDKLQFLPEMTVTWDMGDNVTIAYGDNGSCIAAPFTNFRLEWADSEWNYVDDITLPASGLGYISASELQGIFGEYGSVLRAIIGAQRTYQIDPMHLWTSQYYYSVPVTFYE